MLEAIQPDPRRLAALTLHALAEQDREWVLSQLEPGDREAVNALVRDLVELGIPPDHEFANLAVGRVSPVDRPTALEKTRERAAPDDVSDRPWHHIASRLRAEPELVRGLCLLALEPAERTAVVLHLPECSHAAAMPSWWPAGEHDDVPAALKQALRSAVLAEEAIPSFEVVHV